MNENIVSECKGAPIVDRLNQHDPDCKRVPHSKLLIQKKLEPE